MTVHLHATRAGLAGLVLPTHEAWDHDWRTCGTTSNGDPCDAIAETSGQRCPKRSAVELPSDAGPVRLCGGHFDVHRRREQRLAILEARA